LGELVQQQMKMNGKGFGQFNPQIGNPPPDVDWNKLQDALKKLNEFNKEHKFDPKVKVDPPMPNVDNQPKKDEVPPKPKGDKDAEDLTKWFTKNLGESPAFKDLAKELQNAGGEDKSGLLKDLDKDWKSLFGSTNVDDKLLGGLKLGDFKSDF